MCNQVRNCSIKYINKHFSSLWRNSRTGAQAGSGYWITNAHTGLLQTRDQLVAEAANYPPTYLPTYLHTLTHTHKDSSKRQMSSSRRPLPTYLPTYLRTYTHTHSRRISMPSAGLEPAIPANKWLQTYIL